MSWYVAPSATSRALVRVEEEQGRTAEALARADANFHRARQAVEDYFTTISEDVLLDEPGMQPLRQKLLRTALKYHEGFLLERAEDHTVEAELAQSHRRYANISKDIVKGQDQLPHLRFALARFEQLARQHTDRPEYQWQVAKTLSDIASALWGRDREEATRSERSAIAIYEQLLRDRPEDGGILEDLASSLVNLGVKTASNRGGGEEGAAHMDRARDILQRLIELEPESLRHRLRLAELHDGMYDLFVGSQSRQDEAMRSSQAAIRLYEELLKRVPNSPRFKYRLGKLHDTRSSLYQRKGQWALACDEGRRARTILGDVVRANREDDYFRGVLAGACFHLGYSLFTIGTFQEAIGPLRESCDAFTQIAKKAGHMAIRQRCKRGPS